MDGSLSYLPASLKSPKGSISGVDCSHLRLTTDRTHHGVVGTVGSGKTMLMDDFFDAIPLKRKRRIHFHSFMLDVHSRIHSKKMLNIADPIPPVAADLLNEAYVLCFDEFQVTVGSSPACFALCTVVISRAR
jgi:hypothetical protein